VLEIERENSRSHCVGNWLWERLWTFRKEDSEAMMMMMMTMMMMIVAVTPELLLRLGASDGFPSMLHVYYF